MSSSTTCTWGAGIMVTSMSEASSPKPPLFEVAGLNAFYSGAHVLHDVTFEIGSESVAIIGRNGMGKTTLCAAIMGLAPPRAAGSVKLDGRELLGTPSYKIARAGIGYVPQGRRLFPSLTVDEHLKITGTSGGNGGWTADRVYDLFPDLPNASATVGRNCQVASSRCSRSVVHFSGIRGF